MNKVSDFYAQFTKYLHDLFNLLKNEKESDDDKLLIELGDNEEEKKLIQEVCTNIDLEHDLMEDVVKSQDNGKWFEKELEESVKECYPHVTDKEIKDVKSLMVEGMEKEIANEAQQLEEEMAESNIVGGKEEQL